MHTCKQWKRDYLIQIEYWWHWMVKWKQDMCGSKYSYIFCAFRHLWKLHMKNWYPVSLLTVAPHGDGTQSWNQSNEPPLGDSLLFKNDLMPLLCPTLPRDPKGFNWLVHNCFSRTLSEIKVKLRFPNIFLRSIELHALTKLYRLNWKIAIIYCAYCFFFNYSQLFKSKHS